MNTMNELALALLLILAALPVHAGSVRFTRSGGYLPLEVSDAKSDMGVIQGEPFKKIKGQIQNIVSALVKHERWLPKEAVWWDVGPDAEYLSAVVEMDGKTYTINSWYPLERQSPNIAVSETQGLVPVKSRQAKEDVESKNSATYRQIVAIFDLMPQREFVASISADTKVAERVQAVLERASIRTIIEGSVVYGVSVATEHKARALEILRADSATNNYWIRFTHMSQQEVVRVASRAATDAGYKLGDYKEPEAHFEFVRKDGSWTVFFVRKLPTPPGGHFQVWVDDKTGKTQVMPGQ